MATTRTFRRSPALLLFMLPFAFVQKSNAQDHAEKQIRSVIQKSIPFIEEGGSKWIESKKCVTCHQVTHMTWALNQADAYGFELNRESLKFSNEWSSKWMHMTSVESRETATREETLLKENDAIAALILGRTGASTESEDPDWISQYRDSLIRSQMPDGHWEPQGQLPKQKRSQRETAEVSTMWALLAIATDPEAKAKHGKTFDNAIRWLGEQSNAKSVEWWSARLLLERKIGNDSSADRIRESLIGLQNTDGGWGWLASEESDAFGTGLAIYSLSKDGIRSEHESIRRAYRFLAGTQNENGSWSVRGTKKGNRKGFSRTAIYWGTCWATIGLIESLGDRVDAAVKTEQPESATAILKVSNDASK